MNYRGRLGYRKLSREIASRSFKLFHPSYQEGPALSTISVDKLVDWMGMDHLNRPPISLFPRPPQNEAFINSIVFQIVIKHYRTQYGIATGREKSRGMRKDSVTIPTHVSPIVNPLPERRMAPEVLTVSVLNRRAREILQRSFPLLWVGGEVSNLTRAGSGHVYFSLKDESAQVRCVMFKSRAQSLPWRLENGQQVEAQALVTLFEARGDFQLNIEGLRRAGLGARYEAYARLLDKLEREGLFAAERKRALPRFPRRIGIVTSPQAAALHDVITALRRRAPHLPTILYPVPVQGEGAAEKIAAAIAQAGGRVGAAAIDVLIVVRGGGSIEDLWAFNEEVVARAVADCPVPVVSGIGHETDTTITDFAADRRAATPTAAAELVSAGWFAARHELATLADGLQRGLRALIEARMQRIDLLAHRLIHPGTRLERDRQALAHLATRLLAALAKRRHLDAIALDHLRLRLSRAQPLTQPLRGRLALAEQSLSAAWRNQLTTRRGRLGALAASLTQLSPQATLLRGYSIVRDRQGKVLHDSAQVAAGDAVELNFAVGWARANISETG